MRALAILCLVCGVARAEIYIVQPVQPTAPPPEPPTHSRLFGWRIAGGMLPVNGLDVHTMGLALSVEHRVHGRWRIAGEYEYTWLGVRADGQQREPLLDGNGHRASVSVRRTLVQSRRLLGDTLRFYADAEVGAGMLLATEQMLGTITQPQVFAGTRLGYDFIRLRRDTRASPVWEPEIIVRAVATSRYEPLGYYFGIGINWGD